jgi:hypothetical protein
MVFRSVLIWIIGLNLLIGQNELAGEFQNGICDSFTHHKNQQLCARIVQRKLQTYPTSFTPEESAHDLSLHLDHLAQDLLKHGLDLKAYSYGKCPGTPYLQFTMIPLCEGKTDVKPEIPLTLFIYVWPSENLAKRIAMSYRDREYDPRENYYASHIHGHPLTCSLTVLKGTLCQENYRVIQGWPFNIAKKNDEETLQQGMTAFDDNTSPFIHRLVNRNENCEPTFTLHGYGASTAKDVLNIFQATFNRYAYRSVLNLEFQRGDHP